MPGNAIQQRHFALQSEWHEGGEAEKQGGWRCRAGIGHPSLPGLHPFARLDSLGTLHKRPSCRRESDNEVSLEGKQGSWIRNGKRRYGVHTMDMHIVQPSDCFVWL